MTGWLLVSFRLDLVKLSPTVEFSLNDFHWIHCIQCEKMSNHWCWIGEVFGSLKWFGQSEAVQHEKFLCTIFPKGFHDGMCSVKGIQRPSRWGPSFYRALRSCGKIMFSVICVCLLTGGSMWPLLVMHSTSAYRAQPSPGSSPSPPPRLGTALDRKPSGPTP